MKKIHHVFIENCINEYGFFENITDEYNKKEEAELAIRYFINGKVFLLIVKDNHGEKTILFKNGFEKSTKEYICREEQLELKANIQMLESIVDCENIVLDFISYIIMTCNDTYFIVEVLLDFVPLFEKISIRSCEDCPSTLFYNLIALEQQIIKSISKDSIKYIKVFELIYNILLKILAMENSDQERKYKCLNKFDDNLQNLFLSGRLEYMYMLKIICNR